MIDETNRKRDIVFNQTTQLGDANTIRITCHECNRKIQLKNMSRCLYCGIYFCKKCGKKHFEKEVDG